jgi:hypothetical protein
MFGRIHHIFTPGADQPTPWIRVHLQKLTVTQLVSFSHLMKFEGSGIESVILVLLSSSHLCRGSFCVFSLGFLTKTLNALLISPMRATWPAQLTLFYFVTRIMFHKDKLWSSSLCSFLYPPLLSPLLSKWTILFSTLLANVPNVRNKVPRSSETAYKIYLFIYILIIGL